MADPLTSDAAPIVDQPSPVDKPAGQPAARTRRVRFEMHHRFGIAYLVLAALVGAAVGLFIVFLGRSTAGKSAWSTFKPHQHGSAEAAEIAKYVQGRYRLNLHESLVAVINRDPSLQSGTTRVAIEAVAIRGTTDKVYRTSQTLFYALCGLSPAGDCAIPGQPSENRLSLLRTEILELSLLSFKYAAADSVVAYAPPTVSAGGRASRTVALLRRDDWKQALNKPLSQTIVPQRTLTPGTLAARDKQVGEAVRLYNYQFSPIGDGSAALILSTPS